MFCQDCCYFELHNGGEEIAEDFVKLNFPIDTSQPTDGLFIGRAPTRAVQLVGDTKNCPKRQVGAEI